MIKNNLGKLSIISLFLLNLFPQISYGQENFTSESNKMFVVVAVIAVIFLALVIALFVLENKIKKIQRSLKDDRHLEHH